jgi:hypothetical protein
VPDIEIGKMLFYNELTQQPNHAASSSSFDIENFRPNIEQLRAPPLADSPERGTRVANRVTFAGRLPLEPNLSAVLHVIPQEESRELELLKADIASRLRSACAHFPDAEFAELVDQIARIEAKYARRAGTSAPDFSAD